MQDALAGMILAGGKSQRMGVDKARLALKDGRPLVRSVVEVLKTVCSDVVVVTDSPERYADLALPARSVCDILPDRGPMGGLHAGLTAVESSFALVVACDMPFLNAPLLQFMADLPRDYDALVPKVWQRWQPLHAIYARACLGTLEELLASGRLKMTNLLSRIRVRTLSGGAIRRLDPWGLSFLNLNQPSDLLLQECEPASIPS